MNATQTVRSEVLQVMHAYLGPATERFLDRQIRAHLKKDPQELDRKDIVALAGWLKVSLALLTDDKKQLDEFSQSLSQLAKIEH